MEDKRKRKILERLAQRRQRRLASLEAKLDSLESDPALWPDALKVQEILGISRTTLFRFRKKNTLTYVTIGSRTYYYLPDIFSVRNHFLK